MSQRYQVKLESIDPIASGDWLRFVDNSIEGGIFHHPAWIRMLQLQYHFKVFAFVIKRKNRIVAGVPFCEIKSVLGRKKWVSLPFSDHCEPLADTESDLKELSAAIVQAAHESEAVVHIKTVNNKLEGFSVGGDLVLHVIETNCKENGMTDGLSSRTRRTLKKVEKRGFKTSFRTDCKAMQLFWDIHLETRKSQGVPIQPRSYFKRFVELIINEGLGIIAITEDNKQCVSASVLCQYKERMTYKYGATAPPYRQFSPAFLTMYDSICHAKERGLKKFDFGKTEVSNTGLRQFKSGWGAAEIELAYSYYPVLPAKGIVHSIASHIMSPMIINGPDIICRVAGECLYGKVGVE